MEAELELAQAKLVELKAQAKSAAADTQIKNAKQVDELEEKVGDTKAKLLELAEAGDDWDVKPSSMTNHFKLTPITVGGIVTLKGPVRSEEEKKAVKKKAAGIAGKDKIKSESISLLKQINRRRRLRYG